MRYNVTEVNYWDLPTQAFPPPPCTLHVVHICRAIFLLCKTNKQTYKHTNSKGPFSTTWDISGLLAPCFVQIHQHWIHIQTYLVYGSSAMFCTDSSAHDEFNATPVAITSQRISWYPNPTAGRGSLRGYLALLPSRGSAVYFTAGQNEKKITSTPWLAQPKLSTRKMLGKWRQSMWW